MNILKANNILKAQNRWGYFPLTTSGISSIGTTSTFNYIHETGIFKLEIDYIHRTTDTAAKYILQNTPSVVSYMGFYVQVSTLSVTFRMSLVGANYFVLSKAGLLLNAPNKILIIGDGVGVTITLNGSPTYLAFAAAFENGNTYSALLINSPSTFAYLRNIKIWDNTGLLKHHFTLQDSLNIGKDIISGLNGTVTNVSVVDINEGGNWTSIIGKLGGSASIGTTSTFGWMNAGVFNIQFDLQHSDGTGYGICTAVNITTMFGFFFYFHPTISQIRWVNGSGTVAFINNGTTLVAGQKLKITLQGNGTQYRYIQDNLDTGVNIYNSGWVNCTYVSNLTTAYSLNMGGVGNYGGRSFYVRNFKIFTDFAGTIPYKDLSMQNAETLMTDGITGLQGTATGVSIVNNNTNVLRNKNLWASFSNTEVSRISAIGTVSTFNFIHQTGVFRIDWDMIIPSSYSYALGRRIFANANATVNNGFYIYQSSTALSVGIFTGGASAYLSLVAGQVHDDISHHYILYGTGVAIYLLRDGVVIGSDITPTGSLSAVNATNALNIGHVSSSNPYCFAGYMRNLKIYRSSDTSDLVDNFPLTDGGNIAKGIVGGLQGTVINVNVVEI